MRNLKTISMSTSCLVDKDAENASEQNSSGSSDKMFSYPTVWKKAFTLEQNVRFTRTPEVEILRRRIEENPIFAKRFETFAKQEPQKLTDVAEFKMQPQLTEEVFHSQSLENKVSLYCSTTLGQSVQQTVNTPIEKNTIENTLQVESVAQETKPISYLSDDAFFECEPFLLEQVNVKISQEEDASVNLENNKALLGKTSSFDESVSTFYRVLECHFPQSCNMTVSEVSENDVQGNEGTSDLNYTNDEIVREVQIQSTEPVFGKNEEIEKVQELSVVETPNHEISDVIDTDTAVGDDPHNIANCITTDVTKSVEDLSVTKAVGSTMETTDMSFSNHTSAFIPSSQSVNSSIYELPPIELLQEPVFQDDTAISQEMLERSSGLLESVLEDFGIKGEIIHVRSGPVVTMYEFEPAAGVKSSRVIGLSDDIARSMSAMSARVAVIPGRNVIGIELPNAVRETVYLRELVQSSTFRDSEFKLALALGKGINGDPVIAELAKMPHLLIAGTTGSGKSVAINTMILSILYRMTPEQCRLIMVDPKMLELSIYDGIPHLLTPVVTDPKKAVTALKWAVREMEERYRKMAKLGVRNIDGFNARVALAVEKGETIMCTVQSGFDRESGEILYREEEMDLTQLPYIVIIVDEMADLMMVAGKEIESVIQRLAQMARAAGIHLIMATQRPSVDVITGTIKANFPTRISFQITSKIDSRTILGEQGAETLLGQGDMLHMVGGGRIERVHGPFVSDEEVESVVAHLKVQGTPDYLATVTDSEHDDDKMEDAHSVAEIIAAGSSSEDGEELYMQAVKVVMRDRKCSTSYIQRRLAIGYNKAASLVERMEQEGIVGAANHVGKREILLNGRNDQDGFKST
ncbi:DNA translocase FtsK [Bartonella schoenbuchensis]|uniref:Cell division transmembrane protein n=2 Tax=Bartonella schoenbuchensis TaxID=165694 RepID=E6YZ26_BARSR|nr:DNA translocase FtsK [Bartonella schoenbuchensis]AQX30218.1 DNA segregation ATPase FtsK/SpoIIIE, S-DNA-T family [Bartonella schoenbuchensis R1]CBI81766.1 Cell division transmembrane protein [Bartonella schoenbuchensis R1]CDP79716.1 cell division protein FtsK [Bartonella schoenbuchensis]